MPASFLVAASGVAAHGLVIGVWLVSGFAFFGWGTLLLRWWGVRVASWRDASLALWLGIAMVLIVLQLWHFVRPVDTLALAVLLVGAGVGCWSERNSLVSLSSRVDGRVLAVTAIVLAWIANRALGPTALFDTGMYHQPSVAWTNAFALVPGLGNLHGRLAFNSNALLLAAPFDVGALDGAASHFLNSFLAAALVAEGACAWVSARGERHPRAFDLFSLAVLPNVLHGALRQDVRSLSTDAAACAVLFAAIRVMFDAVSHPEHRPRDRGRAVAAVLLLFTMAVTVKLSTAMVAMAGALIAIWSLLPVITEWRSVARWTTPALVLLAAWLSRGVLLSGYPLYPADVLAASVDWRVPAEQVAGEAAWVTMSARNLNSNVIYPGVSWIGPWIRGVVLRGDPFVQLTVPAFLALAVGALAVTRRQRVRPEWADRWTRAFIPLGAGMVFWLATAPHTRMAQGILWSGAAMALAWWSIAYAGAAGRTPARRLALLVAVVTAAVGAKQVAGAVMRAEPGSRWTSGVEAAFTRPVRGRWMSPPPEPVLRDTTLPSGLRVAVPVNDNACWNTTRLCTPHPSTSLALRVTGSDDPRGGFRSLEGAWAPSRWPNPWTPFLGWWRCVHADPTPDTDAERRCLARFTPPVEPPRVSGERPR